MGIVIKQSFRNLGITYLGFGLGALNTLFLYIQILPESYFGLVTFILASGAILMPLLAFGVHNTMVRFFSGYTEKEKDSFLTLLLFVPFGVAIPLAITLYIFYDAIADLLASENALVAQYLWHIYIVGFTMAYFEIFFAWCKVHLKSVFGNFLKEVFVRLGVSVLLILVYFKAIGLTEFLNALVGLYVIRMLILKYYAYRLRLPKLVFQLPRNYKEVLWYSALIILGGSAALILLEIDKVMLSQFTSLANVAYYGVAAYIATVIIVPSRAMHQITYPLTAELLNTKDVQGLEQLYKRSSLNLLFASGLLFLLIVLNLEDLYTLLPENYRGGFYVVFLIGLAKVFDSFLGNANAILYNSKYYRAVLLFGILLALVTIILNLILIPKLGLEGAALASVIAIFGFNLVKLIFVYQKFRITPFQKGTLWVLILMTVTGVLFYVIPFSFQPLINIALSSVLMILFYLGLAYRFQLSPQFSGVLDHWLKRKTP